MDSRLGSILPQPFFGELQIDTEGKSVWCRKAWIRIVGGGYTSELVARVVVEGRVSRQEELCR